MYSPESFPLFHEPRCQNLQKPFEPQESLLRQWKKFLHNSWQNLEIEKESQVHLCSWQFCWLFVWGAWFSLGGPLHYILDMDEIRNNKLIHELLDINAYGGCRNVPGVIATAVKLRGNTQHLDIGQHSSSCLGNLQRCTHGYTGSMFVKFDRFLEGMYYLSTGDQGINMYYKDGRVHIDFEINGKKWTVPLSQLDTDTWYFLEYTWHPGSLLRVYLNNRLVGAARPEETEYRSWNSDNNHFFIGRANEGAPYSERAMNGEFTIDHHLIWFDTRDNLIANGHIVRGT